MEQGRLVRQSTRLHGLDARRSRRARPASPEVAGIWLGLLRGRQLPRLLGLVASRPAPTLSGPASPPVGVRGQWFAGSGRPSPPPPRPPHYPTRGHLPGGRASVHPWAPRLGHRPDDVVPSPGVGCKEGEVTGRGADLAFTFFLSICYGMAVGSSCPVGLLGKSADSTGGVGMCTDAGGCFHDQGRNADCGWTGGGRGSRPRSPPSLQE